VFCDIPAVYVFLNQMGDTVLLGAVSQDTEGFTQ
jgi:hypothetical protein